MTQDDTDIQVDVKSGVYGHKVTMLDFNPQELAHFRRIGELVGFPDTPGVVETALALSGSAAQSKIQRYPGDADYFERINIKAETRQTASDILAKVMRDKVEATLQGPTYQMIEIKFGSYPQDARRGEQAFKTGSPISWTPREVLDGRKVLETPRGDPLVITWEEASRDPGWCKLDWVVADAAHGQSGQCQQHAGCHLGSAGWQHHPAGWLPGPLFPGGLPGSRFHPAVHQACQACLRGCPG